MQEFYTLKKYEDAFEKAGILKASFCPDNAPDDSTVRLVTFDSREAAEETLFFCKGNRADQRQDQQSCEHYRQNPLHISAFLLLPRVRQEWRPCCNLVLDYVDEVAESR